MHRAATQRVLGMLLMVFSITMLPPLLVSWFYQDGTSTRFLSSMGLTLGIGFLMWVPVRNYNADLRLRDGFMVVVMVWLVLGLSGSLPFMLGDHPHMSLTDSVFESFSGLTTTGATVITGIDHLPRSLLYYRQQLQWLGGMGIIVLAVAIMPMLGIGGMQLYRAETPGPMKESKLTPRITETAKALWYIYLSLTVACGVLYWMAGMNAFDAVGHSFSTIAIGGFSTHDASMGYFNSSAIDMVAVFFMLLAGANFSLHFLAWRQFSLRPYFQDPEVRAYVTVLTLVTLIVMFYLYDTGTYERLDQAFVNSLFQAVSIGTTTGFTTAQYHNWPGLVPVLLIFISFIGACAGSTGGGMKMIRFLLLIKQGGRELLRLVHPNAIIPVKIGKKAISDRVIDAVWGFFAAYVGSFSIMMLVLMMTGLDQVTAFSAVAACMNNLGPGLAEVGANYQSISDLAKWVLCFAMLLGRLEIFTLLVLLSPAFWRP
jgi:trk system potassium uptake protein TrkH